MSEFKLVPVTPTVEMIAALGFDGDSDLSLGHGAISVGLAGAYAAMLAAAPQPPALGGEPETLAVLTLGGVFDNLELGDNDIGLRAEAVEALQERLVRTSDDVHIELVDRAHVARLQVEVEQERRRAEVSAKDANEAEARTAALEGLLLEAFQFDVGELDQDDWDALKDRHAVLAEGAKS